MLTSTCSTLDRKQIYKNNEFWHRMYNLYLEGASILWISRSYNLPWTTVYNKIQILKDDPKHDFSMENRGFKRNQFTKPQADCICEAIDRRITQDNGVSRPAVILEVINMEIKKNIFLIGLSELKQSGLYRFMKKNGYFCTGKGFSINKGSLI